jgi:DNA-binding NarL/FixJ family response regulator
MMGVLCGSRALSKIQISDVQLWNWNEIHLASILSSDHTLLVSIHFGSPRHQQKPFARESISRKSRCIDQHAENLESLMSNLLIIALNDGVPENVLRSLRQSGWQVSATADLVQARHLLQNGGIEAVVVHYNSADQDPEQFSVLRWIRAFCPTAMVVMLNSSGEQTQQVNLVQTLNVMDDARSDASLRIPDSVHLSPAQKRIALLVAQAHPNREIARRLKIKEQSVRNELSRIFKKMHVRNRVELALWMREGQPPVAAAEGQDDSLKSAWPVELQPPTADPASGRPPVIT